MTNDSAFECELPVVAPFRLDLTAEALRRLSTNVVDHFGDGVYMRALQDEHGTAIVRVRQDAENAIAVRITGRCGRRFLPVVQRMLGTQVSLRPWYHRVKAVPWLNALATSVRGVKPPRYPTLWEALCHAIVFQQISIHAAGAIMQRAIERFGTPVDVAGSVIYPFPQAAAIAAAPADELRAVGLSVNKVAALHYAAGAVLDGTLDERAIESMPAPDAVTELSKLRGIGPWSAAVVLLRGLGRLDVFPLKDSGVAASLRTLSGTQEIDVDGLLAVLGEQRGMLYFHLLLGRIAQRREAAARLP